MQFTYAVTCSQGPNGFQATRLVVRVTVGAQRAQEVATRFDGKVFPNFGKASCVVDNDEIVVTITEGLRGRVDSITPVGVFQEFGRLTR